MRDMEHGIAGPVADLGLDLKYKACNQNFDVGQLCAQSEYLTKQATGARAFSRPKDNCP